MIVLDLIKNKLQEMKTYSKSRDHILEVNQQWEGLIILRLEVITGQLNKTKLDQILLQVALNNMTKASLTFSLVSYVERIIVVLSEEPLLHVLIVGAFNIM